MGVDNKGLMDNLALVDSLISDCDSAVGAVAQGKYILWCKTMFEMVQKLALLKNGIVNDLKNRDLIITSLKEQLQAVGINVETVSADKLINVNKTTCQEN